MSDETRTQRLAVQHTRPGVGFRVRLLGSAAYVDVAGDPSGRVFVGSSPACALRVDDPTVSRRHLALQALGNRLRVLDLSSKNGTTLDGVRIESAFAFGGERIAIADSTVTVESVEVMPSDARERPRDRFGELLGASEAMRQIYPLCERLAESQVPVLIEGETGTGKEVLAEALHDHGPRADKPFVVFDCTAVPASLLESELFGYERGAFTGAANSHAGVFEAAHGGTLFIDEIGDLDLAMQPKLLRAIERLSVRRLGASKPISVDVRLVFATRRDLDREVQAGRFRDDLYHRVVVGRVELPPLRDREGDVGLLARAFARALGHPESSIPHEVLVRWEDSPWPGNVRELRNAVLQLLELGTVAPSSLRLEDAEASSDLQALAQRYVDEAVPLPIARTRVVDELERRYIETLLARHGGDIARAAAASGLARRQFFRLKAKLRR